MISPDWKRLLKNGGSFDAPTPAPWYTFFPYLQLWGAALGLMTVVWLLSLWLRDASLVDRYWGIGFVFLYTFSLFRANFLTFRAGLVLILVAVWGLRLSVYIQWRNHGRGEDRRYARMRAATGSGFWWVSLFKVFLLQGTLQWLVSAPLVFVCLFPQADEVTFLDVFGVAIWAMGLLFETVADYQMARFKRNPAHRGKVCREGLWGWSRHPNYFGEALVWWGFWLVCLNTTAGLPAVASPILMTFLLLRVSGVSLLEAELRETKPEYAAYIRDTSAFFPWK